MLQTAPKGNMACVKVTPPQHDGPVIGPLLYCDLVVEGVPVVSMVDCGSQTTIISRSFLHEVTQHLTSDGKPLPEVKMPTVRLWKRWSKRTESTTHKCPSGSISQIWW